MQVLHLAQCPTPSGLPWWISGQGDLCGWKAGIGGWEGVGHWGLWPLGGDIGFCSERDGSKWRVWAWKVLFSRVSQFSSFFIPPSLSPISSSSLSFPFFFCFLFLLFFPVDQQKTSVQLAVAGQLCPWTAGGFAEWLGKVWLFRLCSLCRQPESWSTFWSRLPFDNRVLGWDPTWSSVQYPHGGRWLENTFHHWLLLPRLQDCSVTNDFLH